MTEKEEKKMGLKPACRNGSSIVRLLRFSGALNRDAILLTIGVEIG